MLIDFKAYKILARKCVKNEDQNKSVFLLIIYLISFQQVSKIVRCLIHVVFYVWLNYSDECFAKICCHAITSPSIVPFNLFDLV